MSRVSGKRCPLCAREYPIEQTFCVTDGALLDEVVVPDVVGTIVAGHRVLRMLGEGGMGEVYLAEHVRIGRRCALKVMKPDLLSDPLAVARFEREARNASLINHPNVAALYEFGETDDGALYLAMEFVAGRPLSSILRSETMVAPRRASGIVRQIAAALAAAHQLGIVHRDLKPDNIMVGPATDGGERVKLVDFGISKLAREGEQKVTNTGVTVGTPAYMSPEQVGGGAVDGASDQFSLACTTFEMLTGELPFTGATGFDQVASRLRGPAQQLQQVRADVAWPHGLQPVLERAMSMRPADRYPSVTAFAEAFEQAVEASQASGRPSAATLLLRDGAAIPPTRVSASPDQTLAAPRARRAAWAAVGMLFAGGAAWLALRPASDARTGTPPAAARETSRAVPATREIPGGPTNGTGPTDLFAKREAPSPGTAPHADSSARKPVPDAKGRSDATSGPLDLTRLKQLANAESESQLRAAIAEADRLTVMARTAADSVRVFYYQAQAIATLGDTASACKVLRRAASAAGTLPTGDVVRQTSQELGC